MPIGAKAGSRYKRKRDEHPTFPRQRDKLLHRQERKRMVADRADAMLERMDEVRNEGRYRRIEMITGRRQRRN